MATVTPLVQTDRASGTGDVADHAVFWLHPTDRALSMILGVSKDEESGGLHVFDLDGDELAFLPVGALNNIDVRYNFPLGGQLVDLVAATNRTLNRVQFFTVNPSTRQVTAIGTHTVDTSNIYGFCLAHDRQTGKFYSIPNFQNGTVEQWEIDGSTGSIQATKRRTISVGSQTEGAAADDFLGWLYIGEEDVGIWRYGLDPSSGSTRVAVDNVSGHLAAGVEGLAIYHESDGESGYLIASSQGDSTFQVYERTPPNDWVGEFDIGANLSAGIDAVTDTDGIGVTNRDLSETFPAGAFVAHDGATAAASTNYKVVSWADIADALDLRTPDTDFDPRAGGEPPPGQVAWGEWSDPATTDDPGGVAWGEWSDPASAITGEAPPDEIPELTAVLDVELDLDAAAEMPAATVPELVSTLDLEADLAGTVETPTATIPEVAATLEATVDLAGTLERPASSIPEVAAAVDIDVDLAGSVEMPAASVPELAAASLHIDLALDGTLDVPPATVPELAGALAVEVAASGVLAPPPVEVPELAATLNMAVDLAGAAEAPAATVPEITSSLAIGVDLAGAAETPPDEGDDIAVEVGEPFVRWSTEEPFVRWSTEEPFVRWSTEEPYIT